MSDTHQACTESSGELTKPALSLEEIFKLAVRLFDPEKLVTSLHMDAARAVWLQEQLTPAEEPTSSSPVRPIRLVIDPDMPADWIVARNHRGKALKAFLKKEDGKLLVLDLDRPALMGLSYILPVKHELAPDL